MLRATRKNSRRKKLNKSKRVGGKLGGASFKETWLSDVWQSRAHQEQRLYDYIRERNLEKVKVYIGRIAKWDLTHKRRKKNTPVWSSLRKGTVFDKAAGLACELGYPEMVELFIGRIRNIVIEGDFGQTRRKICDIFGLIENGHRDVAKLFLENDIHTRTPFWSEVMKGRVGRALRLAQENGWIDIVNLLRQKMVNPANPLPISRTTLEVPEGAENTITREKIENGNNLVDFEDELGFKRYYLESTYDDIMRMRKQNPYTRKPIVNARYHTAKIIKRR